MASIKELLLQEAILKQRLEKSIINGKKTPIARRTKGFFETKICDLRILWQEYCNIDLQLMTSLRMDESTSDHEYITADNFAQLEDKYSDYMGEITEALNNLKTPMAVAIGQENNSVAATTANTVTSTPFAVHQEIPLPKIVLPKFNGDYNQWRSFHDLYISLIHNNDRLTAVQKFHHLKTSLIGEAEQIVRHIPLTNRDYEPAWEKLKDCFENTRMLVDHQLTILLSQSKVNTETSKGIKALVNTTEECLQQLKSLEVDTTNWDPLLIHILVQKLPYYSLKLWKEELGVDKNLPTFERFRTFLNTRYKVLESIADTIGHNNAPRQQMSGKPPKEKSTTYLSTRASTCPACNGQHYVTKCPKYKNMTPTARRQCITAAKRCTNCLSNVHAVSECTSKYTCFKCHKGHHTSLHIEDSLPIRHYESNRTNRQEKESSPPQTEANNQSSGHSATSSNTTQSFVTTENLRALLSTAIIMVQAVGGQYGTLRCLVDPGSQSSFITSTACSRLNIVPQQTAVTITGLGAGVATRASKETKLKVQSRLSTGPEVEETFLILDKITDPLPRYKISQKTLPHLKQLHLADPTFWKPGQIDALLGANIYAEILKPGVRKFGKNNPIAINTILGWILLGPTPSIATAQAMSLVATTEPDLYEQLNKFWATEEFPNDPVLNKEDQQCQEHFGTTHTRLASGSYQVELPFLDNKPPTLGLSRPHALARYATLQRQFLRNPETQTEYTRCLDEYIHLGHMETVVDDNNPHYYIPHHAVFKESSTTRLRVVFDASCKTSNGKCLNDFLMKGPVLQPKLFATLLNWRKYKFVMAADIEKMYRMIWVHPDHRRYQRIIWKHPTTGDIQNYQLNTVTFGTASAPFLAIRTLQQLAKDECSHWPLAARATLKCFYVDDLLTGADTLEDATTLQAELIGMMSSANFNLRKWSTNCADLLTNIPIQHREPQEVISLGEAESIKMLGVYWHPADDHFLFKIAVRPSGKQTTKRTMLSEIASLYDPLGWIAPVIITAKILMQSLWLTGSAWDAEVTTDVQEKWTKFKLELPQLNALKIPRWIGYTANADLQLHGFCDASAQAFGAVIYLRTRMDNGLTTSRILTAKTRVAPTKPTTTPRLELNGALILARLLKTTIEDMELTNVPVFAWTDSTVVLQWVREHPSRWKTYVANRVVEIQESVRYDNWYHVPTSENPADLASRGIPSTVLLTETLWWQGPSWLQHSPDKWPKLQKPNHSTELEAKKPKIIALHLQVNDDLMKRYSSYSRLIRIVAYILRFRTNCTPTQTKISGMISNAEWAKAEIVVLRLVQKLSFPQEYDSIENNRLLPRNSKILQLSPFLDSDGLMRVQGRLQNASVNQSQKHPIILPKHHHVTKLIIRRYHQDTLHGGTSLVLATSRQKFWILDARRAIGSEIHQCIICTRYRRATLSQQMGQLPAARVREFKPFSHVGIDYAGPITIKTSALRKAKTTKGYICIFVCMTTKALHIELVSSLTTAAFIAALKRFIARRGLCTDVYSDCGTNFVGGNRVLARELEDAIKEASPLAKSYLVTKGINWHFNPPGAPHFGGLWEAGVRSIKGHLRKTLGTTIGTFEEYATLLAQIECCLNSRPLNYISNDIKDPEVLTPGHFLVGHALNALPEPSYIDSKICLSERWKNLQKTLQHFWKRWSREYLHQLQTRPKWQSVKTNIKEGDIVIIKNELLPTAEWPLGIVTRVIPGPDKLVRVADIRTKHGLLRRPISKLCLLPIQTNTPHH